MLGVRSGFDIGVAAAVVTNSSILLVQEAKGTYAGCWGLPKGYVEPNESIETAVLRELKEETGLTVAPGYIEQLKTYGDPDRDPRNRVISIAYIGIGPTLDNPVGGSDATHAEFISVEDLNDDFKLAFDHQTIVSEAVERARSKLEYSTIATEFCPPEFTISELRHVYEIIWGTSLDAGNFQKKVLKCDGYLEEVGKTAPSTSTGGRPAKLYKAGPAEIINLPIRNS